MTGRDGSNYTWVRCPGCARGLWRRYADRIEMKLRPRGHQRRTIRKYFPIDESLRVQCEYCLVWWTGASQETLIREETDA